MILKGRNTFVFEKRPYTETATTEEIKAIQESLWIEEKGLIWLVEVPVMTPFSINLMFDELIKLGQQFEKYVLLVDIRASERPDAMTRRTLNERFKDIDNISHVIFCTGKNFLINTAIRFTMFQAHVPAFTVCKTIEEATQLIHKHK